MENIGNLVSHLFKARYFPKCDFLDSIIGHNPSYVWRSIWNSKFLVQNGYKWSIGSGENILVRGQNWLHDYTLLNNPWPPNAIVDNLKV